MRAGLAPGAWAEVSVVVTEAMVARFDELGLVHRLYATWMMVKHMEEASRKLILPYLEPHEEAMGHAVEVVHLAPTPVGARVRVRATLERVEGRRVYTRVEAFNEQKKVGEGRHIQALVPRSWLEARYRCS